MMLPPRGPLPSIDPADYGARLAIVIPYRDREQHLSRLITHDNDLAHRADRLLHMNQGRLTTETVPA